MMGRWLVAAAGIATLGWHAAPAIGGPTSAAAPLTVSIDEARIDRALAAMVSSGRAAGVSVLVFKEGREAYFSTAGHADREAKRPMRRDTIVQIFSMTKPVTGVALMQLWEQGKFGLDDPLGRYLPEFAETKVFAGLDSAGKPVLKVPDRPILIRDVLRHTAGFAYGPGDSFPEQEFARIDPLPQNLAIALPEFGRRLAQVPLLFEPGTQWRYSAAVDVQALLVEKLTGEQFAHYVQRRVLQPLGMRETGWAQPESRFNRLAVLYNKGASGLDRVSDVELRRLNFAPKKLTMGGAGLASTIDDYMRFARMLANGGHLDGQQILKPSTVKLMATDQLDPRVTERSWLPGKGNGGFGFNFFVRTGQPKEKNENRGAVGEYFWDGLGSTLFWIDPVNALTIVFLVQTVPFDGSLHHDLRKAIYGDVYAGPEGA
jgi:CubicO group peptidase (beta-lactamase class C family)